ncbi:hypothetical protein [Streptomyces sp. C36]|uniref:hypothetical protein n=1 Tax=Streptomyces sp. C36 TaxID=3237122 RepID=UPI0034C6552C
MKVPPGGRLPHLLRPARSEGGGWRLPIAAAEFDSLYEIQEGSHVKGGRKSSTGYFAHGKK